MDNSDKIKFAEIMAGLSGEYGVELNKPNLAMRFELLKQFSVEQIKNAVLSIIATRKYNSMPKTSEIIEKITGEILDIKDIAEVECGKVLDTIHRHGGGQTVVFDDPVTQAVIKIGFGGWAKLCSELIESEEKWFRKDFIAIYNSYYKSGIKEYGKMIGYHDRNNSASFNTKKIYTDEDGNQKEIRFIQKSVYIGNEDKCKQIESVISDNNVIEYDSKLKQITQGIG